MIKIIAEKGKYTQRMEGDVITVMCETREMLEHVVRQEDGVKAKEKLVGFVAMLGISKVFTKSQMLELLHDAYEDKSDESKIASYIAKAVDTLKGDL